MLYLFDFDLLDETENPLHGVESSKLSSQLEHVAFTNPLHGVERYLGLKPTTSGSGSRRIRYMELKVLSTAN